MTAYDRLHQAATGRTDLSADLREIAIALRQRAGVLYAGCDGTACMAIAELNDAADRIQARAAAYERRW